MANVNWIPPDISGVCSETVAPLTQCSQTGFMFLALVARLFGGSIGNRISYPKANPYRQTPESPYTSEEGIGGIGVDVSSTGQSSKDPRFNFQNQVGPELINTKQEIGNTPVNLGPELQTTTGAISNYANDQKSHQYPGNGGYPEAAFYTGPDFEFESDTFSHPLAKYYFSGLRNFGERRSGTDSDTAYSETVDAKMKKNENRKQPRRKRHAKDIYDFIIVGAGSAGCVIANRLSEVKKWKILLIEAGPEEPDVTSVPSLAPTLGRSSIDWMYRTQPEELTCRAQQGQTCAWLSGRVMGGSSSINYLVYMRGNKKDYDDWAASGNVGWSYRDVLPYFIKSENNRDIEGKDSKFHGINGSLTVERFANIDKNIPMLISALNETGLPLVDFNGEKQIGTMTTQTTSKDGERVSTNRAFIGPIRMKRHNLHVQTNSQVLKIEIDPRKLTAYGIKYLKNGVFRKAYARREIIVSAGALNSPKLLLLSGIGPEEHLQSVGIPVYKNLKVGHNLQDHATVDAFLMKLSNVTSTLIKNDQILTELLKFSKYKSKYKDGLLSATGPLHISAFVKTKVAESDESVPDIQLHFDGRNSNDFYSSPSIYLASNIFPLAYYDAINVRPILLSPKSRGYLKLNQTNPIFGQPLIYPNFFTDRQDITTLIEGLKYAMKLEKTRAFKDNQVQFIKVPVKACEDYEWGSHDYLFCIITKYTATIFHPAGTCKMGPKGDKDAVVDSRLKVHGIRNLRVADASIMPNIVRGNTNAPVIMIGEKVSDMIKEDWKL